MGHGGFMMVWSNWTNQVRISSQQTRWFFTKHNGEISPAKWGWILAVWWTQGKSVKQTDHISYMTRSNPMASSIYPISYNIKVSILWLVHMNHNNPHDIWHLVTAWLVLKWGTPSILWFNTLQCSLYIDCSKMWGQKPRICGVTFMIHQPSFINQIPICLVLLQAPIWIHRWMVKIMWAMVNIINPYEPLDGYYSPVFNGY